MPYEYARALTLPRSSFPNKRRESKHTLDLTICSPFGVNQTNLVSNGWPRLTDSAPKDDLGTDPVRIDMQNR
jgi:hypothetical protein